MSSISNWHLFCLVLMAIPFSFSGLLGKTNAAPASGLPDFGSSTVGPLLASMAAASSAVTTGSSLSPSSILSSVTPPSQTQGIIVSSGNGLSPPYPTTSQISATATKSLIPFETQSYNFETPFIDTYDYGNATIIDGCGRTLKMRSEGAYRLNGYCNSTTGYSALEDQVWYLVPPRGDYTEYFRLTPMVANGSKGYDYDWDKQDGQGVFIKIADPIDINGNIMQLEYALTMNPLDNLDYYVKFFDISLLDCLDPVWFPEPYGISLADSNHRTITDSNMTPADLQQKIDGCPGYQNGMRLSHKDRSGNVATVREQIDCVGNTKCLVYCFERTLTNEPSKACTADFRGDMVLELRAGNMVSAGGG
jgi:hypothetical protein